MLLRDIDTGFPCYVPVEIRFKVGVQLKIDLKFIPYPQ